MTNKKKLLLAVACMALAVCSLVTGTVAWLTMKTAPITNTFSTSDITITLTETDTGLAGGTSVTGKSYQMIPGAILPKNPTVTVAAGSEDCWIFVKVDKVNDPDRYLDYSIDTTIWTLLPDETGVYYCKVTKNATQDQTFPVLTGNQVKVKDSVNKTDMAVAQSAVPNLTFTAYACQLTKGTGEFTAADAWAQVKDLPSNP